jgi:uncharacterized alpha-E superfamily protein
MGERERYERFAEARGSDLDEGEVVQDFLVWDGDCPSSIYSGLYWARENARTIRETISLEMWRTINELWIWLGERSTRRLYQSSRHEFYQQIVERCLVFLGAEQGTMLHEEAFDFLHLGTTLERINQTARILDLKYHALGPSSAQPETSAETAQWLAILRSCSGVEPFFKRSENVLGGEAVAEFLLKDDAFPRSVLHNIERARNFHRLIGVEIDRETGAESADRLDRLAERIRAWHREAAPGSVHRALTEIIDEVAEICSLMRREFFDVAPAAGASASTQGGPGGANQTQSG